MDILFSLALLLLILAFVAILAGLARNIWRDK